VNALSHITESDRFVHKYLYIPQLGVQKTLSASLLELNYRRNQLHVICINEHVQQTVTLFSLL